MDVTPLLTVLLETAAWLFALLLLAGLLRSPRVKGCRGELRVRLLAYWLLDRRIYRRLHNVTLLTPDGSTQIDHVFLSPFGIFVLETKNMSGRICGDERQPQWTQQFPRQSFHFQNPLRQNYRHLKALETVLGIAPEHLHSVVVFVGGGHFATPMPANVVRGTAFVEYIRSFRQPVFDAAEVDALLRVLRDARQAPSLATHRRHVQSLKQRNAGARQHCPACGSPMVLRTARSGPRAGQQFWGCSAYPRCRTTCAL